MGLASATPAPSRCGSPFRRKGKPRLGVAGTGLACVLASCIFSPDPELHRRETVETLLGSDTASTEISRKELPSVDSLELLSREAVDLPQTGVGADAIVTTYRYRRLEILRLRFRVERVDSLRADSLDYGPVNAPYAEPKLLTTRTFSRRQFIEEIFRDDTTVVEDRDSVETEAYPDLPEFESEEYAGTLGYPDRGPFAIPVVNPSSDTLRLDTNNALTRPTLTHRVSEDQDTLYFQWPEVGSESLGTLRQNLRLPRRDGTAITAEVSLSRHFLGLAPEGEAHDAYFTILGNPENLVREGDLYSATLTPQPDGDGNPYGDSALVLISKFRVEGAFSLEFTWSRPSNLPTGEYNIACLLSEFPDPQFEKLNLSSLVSNTLAGFQTVEAMLGFRYGWDKDKNNVLYGQAYDLSGHLLQQAPAKRMRFRMGRDAASLTLETETEPGSWVVLEKRNAAAGTPAAGPLYLHMAMGNWNGEGKPAVFEFEDFRILQGELTWP